MQHSSFPQFNTNSPSDSQAERPFLRPAANGAQNAAGVTNGTFTSAAQDDASRGPQPIVTSADLSQRPAQPEEYVLPASPFHQSAPALTEQFLSPTPSVPLPASFTAIPEAATLQPRMAAAPVLPSKPVAAAPAYVQPGGMGNAAPVTRPAPVMAPFAPAPAPIATPSSVSSDDSIRAIIDAHLAWATSGGKEGKRANFRQADLRGMNLSNAFLAEASFRGADLSSANLNGSDLRGADFSEAILADTHLSNAQLHHAVFARADLRSAHLQGASLREADLNSAQLAGAYLPNLDFSGANLQEADVRGAQAQNAVFASANLRGADFSQANLSGADLSHSNCKDANFEQAVLDKANFQDASLRNARIHNATLVGTQISSSTEHGETHKEPALLELEQEKHQQERELLQTERKSLDQEKVLLQSDRLKCEALQKELQQTAGRLTEVVEQSGDILEEHLQHSKSIRTYTIIWAVATLLIAAGLFLLVQALNIQTLNIVAAGTVVGICGGIMLLFVLTLLHHHKIARNAERLSDILSNTLSKAPRL